MKKFLVLFLLLATPAYADCKVPESVTQYFQRFNLPVPDELCKGRHVTANNYPAPVTVSPPSAPLPRSDGSGGYKSDTPGYGPPEAPQAPYNGPEGYTPVYPPPQANLPYQNGQYISPDGKVVIGPHGIFIDLPKFHLSINF